jgi:hypothetical protein
MSWDLNFSKLWDRILKAGLHDRTLGRMSRDELYTLWLCFVTNRTSLSPEEWRDIYIKDMYAQTNPEMLERHAARWQDEMNANPYVAQMEEVYAKHMAHLKIGGMAQYHNPKPIEAGEPEHECEDNETWKNPITTH